MRKFNVKVNGQAYEVEIEEVGAFSPAAVPVTAAPAVPAVQAAPAQSVQAPAPAAQEVASPAVTPSSPAATGAITVLSPMPGTIIKLNAAVGQSVKKGETIVVLEAMKMENDIPCPEDGVIASVNVTQGASVNAGDLLISIN